MSDNLGTARIGLDVDLASYMANVARAKGSLEGFGAEAQNAFNQADSKAKAGARSLARYTEMVGKSADEVKLLRAEWAGVDSKIIDVARQRLGELRAEEEATTRVTRDMADAWAQAQQKARDAFRGFEARGAAMDAAVLQEQAARRVAAAQEEVAASARRAQAAQQNFSSAVRNTATYSGEYGQRVDRMRQAVSVFANASEEQLAALNKTNAALARGSIEFNKYGISAKQNVAALRQVPAQLTDIIVSLQGGQAPLTVLLQQGGQLRDIFGGVVPAARALGGALLSLINPYTVLGTLIAATAISTHKGANEFRDLENALILTGNRANTTAGELAGLARNLDNMQGVTQSRANAALITLVNTGAITGEQLETVARSALKMEAAGVKSVAAISEEFRSLARDPLDAVLRLNESQNFLTRSTLDSIAKLVEQGQQVEAARVAIEAYSTALNERAGQITENLGYLERGWRAIKNGAAEAWDAMLGIGRDDPASRIKALQNQIGRVQNRQDGFTYYLNDQDRAAEVLRLRVEMENERLKLFGRVRGTVSGVTKDYSEGLKNWTADVKNLRTESQRLDADLERIARNGKAIGKTDAEIKALQDQARAKYADKGGAGAARSLANAESRADLQAMKDTFTEQKALIASENKVLQAQYAARLVSATDYYAKQRDLVNREASAEQSMLQSQIDSLRQRNVTGKDSVDTQRQIGVLEAQIAKSRADAATETQVLTIQEKALADTRRLGIEAYRESLDLSNTAAQREVDAALARISMGQREADQRQKIADILADSADKERELAREFAQTNDAAMYQEKLAELRRYTQERVRITEDGYQAMRAAEANWLNGLKSGLADYIENSQNVAQQSAQVTGAILNGAAQSLTDFAVRSENAFGDMLRNVGEMLTQFLMQKAVMEFANLAYGLISAYFGSTNSSTGAASTRYVVPNAKGNVYQSPSLSAYSGQVVSQPTPFYFAKGAGVMGEAGPEGIFPLKRGTDGKLGVVAHGGGEGVVINVGVTVQADGSANVQAEANDPRWRQVAESMGQVARNEIQRQIRPGGDIYRAVRGT